MAAKENKHWWDSYETSHRKHFVSHPKSAPEIFLRPLSTSLIDSYSHSGPLCPTVYNKEFSWKPASKAECIHTGTSSGQRRNNPHPSQGFMVWRLPRDAPPGNGYLTLPCNCSRFEGEIQKALKAQYCSTYTCDFMGMPQGSDGLIRTGGQLALLHKRYQVPLSSDSEMMSSYCPPRQKPELLVNVSKYSSRDPHAACCGIVPAVVQRHMQTQKKGSNLTTYDMFCGKRLSDAGSVVKSLLPQELQQFHRILTKKETKTVKAQSKDAFPKNGERVHKLPLVQNPSSSAWISSWPDPT